MPTVTTWFQRLREIRQAIEQFPAEVVDRATLERVFRVRRRTAINLMARFGGYQAGRTFLVPKQQLLQALAAAQADTCVQQEIGRKERLRSLLSAGPAATAPPVLSVRLPADRPLPTFSSLPPTTEFHPSELRIRYSERDDLLTQLALLAQAIAADPQGLESRTRPQQQPNPERQEMARLFAELEQRERQHAARLKEQEQPIPRQESEAE